MAPNTVNSEPEYTGSARNDSLVPANSKIRYLKYGVWISVPLMWILQWQFHWAGPVSGWILGALAGAATGFALGKLSTNAEPLSFPPYPVILPAFQSPHPQYSEDELKTYWLAKCPGCGWQGLSRDCIGGHPIAGIGDFTKLICPDCFDEVKEI